MSGYIELIEAMSMGSLLNLTMIWMVMRVVTILEYLLRPPRITVAIDASYDDGNGNDLEHV